MTTYDWHATYRDAVETFNGATPGAELEQLLLETFQHSPQTVIAAISKAAAGYKAGKITSPWGIIRIELSRVSTQPHLHVTDTRSKERAIQQAEAWIRHTGLHLDQDEILTTLFAPQDLTPTVDFLEQLEVDTRGRPGRVLYDQLLKAAIRRTREVGQEPVPNTGGPLTDQDTPALRQRMLTIWQEQQERARTIEAETVARAEQWKATRQAILKPKRRTDPDDRPPPDENLYDPEATHE